MCLASRRILSNSAITTRCIYATLSRGIVTESKGHIDRYNQFAIFKKAVRSHQLRSKDVMSALGMHSIARTIGGPVVDANMYDLKGFEPINYGFLRCQETNHHSVTEAAINRYPAVSPQRCDCLRCLFNQQHLTTTEKGFSPAPGPG